MKRMFVALFLLLFCSICASASEPAITTKKISDNFYVFYGGGGLGANAGMSIGEDGVLLVDVMKDTTAPMLYAEIRKITDKPVKYVINTHGDFDHAGGNNFFKEKGAVIIGQSNAHYSSAKSDIKIGNAFTLEFNGETIAAKHVEAHSFNDMIIYFPIDNIIFTGDTFTNQSPPYSFIDGARGQLMAIEAALGFSDEETTIVPGHGGIDNASGLRAYREKFTAWIGRIKTLHDKGMTAAEMVRDAKLNEIKQRFLVINKGEEVADARFERLVARTLSSDFVDAYALPEEVRDAYPGIYRKAEGGVVEVFSENDRLFLRQEGAFMWELAPQSLTEFKIRVLLGDSIVFNVNRDTGAVIGFEGTLHGGPISAKRIAAP